MPLAFAEPTDHAIPVHIVTTDGLDAALAALTDQGRNWAEAQGFTADLGQVLTLPDDAGGIAQVLVGYGTAAKRARGRFHIGAVARKLPIGTYKIASGLAGADLDEAALAWLLAGYSYDRYKRPSPAIARLVAPDEVDAGRIATIANGDALTRELINTPASDMGPDELEEASRTLAAGHDAQINVIRGDDLIMSNFPMIHTVGRASTRAPRLIDLRWGTAGPMLTLVGKGVCFETGGLNIKPGSSMGLMKKDMGGAATVLG
ncbi:MAG: leucyl aminopeptidase family protein, partial [Paracoccaceae bacterium]|nr:leucyl aminopeptidase family protein [Paracoccaceae bacterium]